MIRSFGDRIFPVAYAGQTSWQRPHSVHENESTISFHVRSPTVPTPNLCGAPLNPWGYSFCVGSTITSPPLGFCTYFACIATFANGRGFVMQCTDGMYSLSGGIPGSCSQHGGNRRALLAP